MLNAIQFLKTKQADYMSKGEMKNVSFLFFQGFLIIFTVQKEAAM